MIRCIVPILLISTMSLMGDLPAQEEIIEREMPPTQRMSDLDVPIVVRLSELDTGHVYDSILSEVVQRYRLAVANSSDEVGELRDALADILAKQYDQFAFHDEPDDSSEDPADDLIRVLTQKRRDAREDFIELRLTILEHRAAGDAVPEMIAQSFRDLCNELDLHVRPDHAIHEGALDPERRLLAIEFPHICCLGCVQVVRDAIVAMEDAKDVEVDLASKTCQFTIGRDVDVQPKLNELAGSRKVFEDWSVVWSANGSDE